MVLTEPIPALLFDPFLALAAEILDDAEKVWIANNNRLSVMTRAAEDKDGEERGWGLTEDHPDVARLAALVDMLDKVVKEATKNLEKRMRQHPLGPWQKQAKGVGEKQLARLLAAIGDPYWNDLHTRPRTVSELWAYCGFHVLPAGHRANEAQSGSASGTQAGGRNISQEVNENHRTSTGVAPRRQRGQKSNWSEDARKRAWLIATSVVKAGGPYREVYDATKTKYADAVHTVECMRCGPKGKPAQVGSPLSKARIHARGLRAISKAVLKDLWIESKRLHEASVDDQAATEARHGHVAGGSSNTPTSA
jgi:hypothetical protein